MHLTNYSVNKNNCDYKANDEEDSLNGHKWYAKRCIGINFSENFLLR